MDVTDIGVVPRRDGFTLRGAIDGFALEYHFENVAPPSGPARGDAFLAAALLPAMVRGEALSVSAPVSARLLSATDDIMAIYRSWCPRARTIRIDAPLANDGAHGDRTAAFFSAGVDSFYTLLKPRPYGTPPSHVIVVHGFDVAIDDVARFTEMRQRVERIAVDTKHECMVVATNLRTWSDPIVAWGLYHGAALVSVAHAFHGMFRRVLIGSTHAYQELLPWGSHPLLDHWWSTDATEVVHDGAEALRTEKIKVLASHPAVLAHLRVCWQPATTAYNCGVCEKCVRTMIGLHIAGVLDRAASFPSALDPAAVRRIRAVSESDVRFLEDLQQALTDSPRDRELAAALRYVIRRRTMVRRARRLAGVVLGRHGADALHRVVTRARLVTAARTPR